MANVVQLELMVDSAGAVQGVRAFDANIKGTTASVAQLNAQLRQTAATSEGATLAKTFTAGEGSIRTMNAELRSLQGSIFGDTRAATEFLASIKGVGAAMELAFPVFGASALIGVLILGSQKLHELYESWIDVDGAVRKYQISAMNAAQTKIFEDGSLESQVSLLQDINDQVDALQAKQRNSYGLMTSLLLGSDAFPHFSSSDAKDLGKLRGLQAQQQIHQWQVELDAQKQRSEDEQRVAEARVPEYGRPAIEREYAHRRAGYQQLFTQQRDDLLLSTYNTGIDAWNEEHPDRQKSRLQIPANDGTAQYQQQVDAADAQYKAAELERARANAEQIRQLHEQMLESRLAGEALYTAKMEYELDDLKRKGIASAAAVADVKARYHNEAMRHLQQEQLATEDIQMRAAMSGMTGVGKIQAQGELDVGNVMGDRSLSPQAKSDRISAIHQQAHQAILAEEQTYTQQIDQIVDEGQEHQISGFARIRAEAQRQLDDLKKNYDRETRSIDTSAPEGRAAAAFYQNEYQRGKTAIGQSSQSQRAELARRNEEETGQIESQARARFLVAEKQKTTAIEEEYNERVRKYRDQLNQQQISQDDFNRRVLAAAEEMNAELADSARQAREKLAGELRPLLSAHPLVAIEQLGAKAASNAGASLLQRLSAHYGASATSGAHESIWERMAGAPHLQRERQMESRGGGPHGEGVLAIQMATIHVASASFVGSGGGTPSGGSLVGQGSTTSAAPSLIARASHYATGVPVFSSTASGGTASSIGAESGWQSAWGSGMSPHLSGDAGGGISGAGGVGASIVPPGSPPPQGPGFMGIASDAMSSVGTVSKIAGIMHRSSAGGLQPTDNNPTGLLDANGNYTSGAGSPLSKGAGAAGDALGLFSAHKEGGLGGTLSGAMSGAKLGMMVAGPIGGAVGALAGAAIGFFGGGEQARVWWLKQGQPRLFNDTDAYEQGSMDYLSAYMDMEQLDTDAKHTLKKMGFAGSRYYSDTVEGEIRNEITKLDREQKAGRSSSTFSAAMYATGVDSVPAMLSPGERVVPSDQNERITRSLEGAHALYRSAMQGGSRGAPTMAPDTRPHLHIHAIDAKSFVDMLHDNSDGVRSAYTRSFERYGGSADVSA